MKPQRRIRIVVSGVVQGVGFRPFVYRCAKERGLSGFVSNSADGVIMEVQGDPDSLKDFIGHISKDHPPMARILDMKIYDIPSDDNEDFAIEDSRHGCLKEPLISPDFSLCEDCLKELSDPADRRYRYPFINCTNCGPRFTIIKGLPYDRPFTSMAPFQMCNDCLQEYNDPLNRRFHAEANACPLCGPRVSWIEPDGTVVAEGYEALRLCGDAIKTGHIAAVKGIGGFHLMADAADDAAVCLLRERKIRQEKPFAVIFPPGERNMLSYVRKDAFLGREEENLILAGERPIVIVKRREDSRLSRLIAPGLDTMGVFLPYSPLHHILLEDLKRPLIATSANLSDSPVIKDNGEAADKLKGLVDGLLIHNRDIVRRCDDSVMAVRSGRRVFFRRSRGYTPQTFKLPYRLKEPVLSVGGNQKVTIALGWEDKAVISQHIGDLSTGDGFQAFEHAIRDLTDFYNVKPLRIAFDMHPDYLSTKWALSQNGIKHIPVQHHHAHAAACMLDNNLKGRVLAVSWDGTGYGIDGMLWGGEFLIADYKGFERFCAFRKFRLVGGEQAVKEPRRALLSILYEMYGEDIIRSQKSGVRGQKIYPDLSFTRKEMEVFLHMLKKGFNSPLTTSCGRVFDAVGSLLGLCQMASYEGQAAMTLEAMAGESRVEAYPIKIKRSGVRGQGSGEEKENSEPKTQNSELIFDWGPVFKGMIEDMMNGVDAKIISGKFHETLAGLILSVAQKASQKNGINKICLSGGVFQNRVLTERVVSIIRENGLNIYTHNLLPPNDGGISLGQLVIAGASDAILQ